MPLRAFFDSDEFAEVIIGSLGPAGVLMPLRAFFDSDFVNLSTSGFLLPQVLMPLRAFFDSDS